MVSLSSFADVENALKDLEKRLIASSQQAWSGANSQLEEMDKAWKQDIAALKSEHGTSKAELEQKMGKDRLERDEAKKKRDVSKT